MVTADPQFGEVQAARSIVMVVVVIRNTTTIRDINELADLLA